MILVALAVSTVVFGQSSSQPQSPLPLDSDELEIKDRRPGADMLPFELTRSAERLVRITTQDKRRYERLRKGGGLKMVKLFSAPGCASKRYVVDVSSNDCLAGVDLIRTSFYSLARGLYGESIADIRIVETALMAGNDGFHHGMIMDLGAIEPLGIDLRNSDADALWRLETAGDFDEEVEARERLRDGVDVRGKMVSSSVTMQQGHTYLVRLVNYSYRRGSRNMFQRDVIYVLHLAELNRDRTALFLWRKLADRPAPRL